MRKIYGFVFFCLYSMVPKKSMYGQKNAAVVLISLIDCALITSVYFLAMVFINEGLTEKSILAIAIVALTVGSFFLNSRYFENKSNFKQIIRAHEPIKLFHRILGAAIFLSTFVGYLLIIRFLDLFVEANY
jgi:hypothetical protein